MSGPRRRDVERVHAARRALDAAYRDAPWFVGTGIVPTPRAGGAGFGLRLVVDPSDESDDLDVPATFDGFPLEIVRKPRYLPRPGQS